MSSTSDSDEESEARKDRLARLQEFRARKNQKDAALAPAMTSAEEEYDTMSDEPLCVQIGWPFDYIEYTGIWKECRRRGWHVVGMDRRPMPDPSKCAETHISSCGKPDSASQRSPCDDESGSVLGADTGCLIPNVQFVPYKKTAWPAVLKGQVLANHYYMRSGIIRKAELATTLMPSLRACHPETHVAHLKDAQARQDFVQVITSVAQRGGVWVLKAGDSSNATDMFLFDETRVDMMCRLVCETQRAMWLAQKYIERPLLIRGFKFHIRATVLAVGRLKVYLHRQAIALMASRPYGLDDLGDLAVHASNHSVANRLNPQGIPEAVLLSELHGSLDSPPPILHVADLARVWGGSGGGGDLPTTPTHLPLRTKAHEEKQGASDESTQDKDRHRAQEEEDRHRAQEEEEMNMPRSIRSENMAPPSWPHIGDEELGGPWAAAVWREIREATWRVFHSALHCDPPAIPRIFRAVPCSFEVFGLDAMIDQDGRVWLLELNCDPDLKVFDERFHHVAKDIVKDTIDAAVVQDSGGWVGGRRTGSGGGDSVATTKVQVGGYHLVLDYNGPDRFFETV